MDAEKSKKNRFREVKFDSCKNCPNIETKREWDTDFKPTPHCKEDNRWFRHIKPINMICDEHPSIKERMKAKDDGERCKECQHYGLKDPYAKGGCYDCYEEFNNFTPKKEVKPNGKKEENKEKNNEEEKTND